MPLDAHDKECRRCGAVKPLSDFYAHRGYADAHDSICKVCNKTKTYEWRRANPSGHARIQKRYADAHREQVRESCRRTAATHDYENGRPARRWADPHQRAVVLRARRNYRNRKRANGGRMTSADVREILAMPCAYCGGKATELDHIVPVSRGGTHSRENVAPACRSCNARKGKLTTAEWEVRRVTKVVIGECL